MLADLWFHLSRLLISSCVFSRSGGTGTELADLGPVWADEEAQAVLEPEPVSRHNFRHARSSRTAILREEEAGFYVRLHEDGSITWEGHVTLAQTDPSRRAEEARERQLANSTCSPASGIMYVRSQGPGDRVRPRPLVSGSGLELDHQPSRHPSAVFHVDPLRLSPLADLGAVHTARRCPAPAAGWPSRTAPSPPGRVDVARQRIPQRLGMLGVQVDLVFGAVQAEADSAFSLTAIEVIDEQGLYLLGHRFSIPH